MLVITVINLKELQIYNFFRVDTEFSVDLSHFSYKNLLSEPTGLAFHPGFVLEISMNQKLSLIPSPLCLHQPVPKINLFTK